jgi:hypothetical protein
MSVKEFLEKLLVIEKELEKNPKSPMDNYLFANVLYNLSYFGNSNILTTVYRSVYSFTDYDLQKEKIDKAIKHYTIALEEAQEKEFKAKITYMLAKVELALFDGKYFDSLKKDYSDTKYYKELIKECANLRVYEKSKR